MKIGIRERKKKSNGTKSFVMGFEKSLKLKSSTENKS